MYGLYRLVTSGMSQDKGRKLNLLLHGFILGRSFAYDLGVSGALTAAFPENPLRQKF